MSSRASRRKDIGDVIKKIQNQNRKNSGLNRQNFSGLASAEYGDSTSSSSGGTAKKQFDTSGLLKTSGDTMIGPIAFFYSNVVISDGIITLAEGTSGHSSRIVLEGESTLDDNLDTINGAIHDGQLLFIQAHNSTDIMLKHLTGNIFISSGTDFALTGKNVALLVWDSTNTQWVLISGEVGAGGADNLGNHIATQDLDMGTSDITNVTDIGSSLFAMEDLWVNRIRLQTGVAGTNFPTITANSPTGDMEINVPSTKSIFLEHNGTIRHTFTTGGQVTLGTGTFGGTLASGSHFSTASGSTSITSTITTITSANGITMNVSGFSQDFITTVSGQNSFITLHDSGNAGIVRLIADGSSGGTPNGEVLLSSTNKITLDAPNTHISGKLVYDGDPTNTYIDLVTGSGDILITTKDSGNPITIKTEGASGSPINIQPDNSSLFITSTGTNAIVDISGMDLSVEIGEALYVDSNDSTGGRSNSSGIYQSSSSGVTPKVLELLSWQEGVFLGYGETTTDLSRGVVLGYKATGDPTSTQIPSGYYCVCENTTSNTVRMWYNDSGTLKKSAAFT